MRLYVARRANRVALHIPTQGTKANPDLLFLLPKTDKSELDDLVRAQLDKQGISKESDVQSIVDKAEAAYEQRVKVAEAEEEVKRLMRLRAAGAKLMSAGHKKWKPYESTGTFRQK